MFSTKLILIFCSALIFLASVINPPSVPMGLFYFSDKIMHMIIYTPLGALFVIAFPNKSKIKSFLYALAFAGIFGFAMEVIQIALPWRSFDLLDEVFNILGGATGAALSLLILKFRISKNESSG